jgi:Bor protein
MRKVFSLVAVLVLSISLMSGCFTMNHIVGEGSKTGTTQTARQWYALWGLVPINSVDSKAMAGGATDYSIKTQYTPLDFIINFFTSIVTVESMTVEVTK